MHGHEFIIMHSKIRIPKHVIFAKMYVIYIGKREDYSHVFLACNIQPRQITCKIGRLDMESMDYMFQLLNAYNI